MDVDTINGEMVGTKLTPTISNYITQALEQNPNVRVGVPASIYRALPPDQRALRAFVDPGTGSHIHHRTLGRTAWANGGTVRGFKPDATQGFVIGLVAAEDGATALPPAAPRVNRRRSRKQTNPMDAADLTVFGERNTLAHSAINMIGAAPADLPFILAERAAARRRPEGRGRALRFSTGCRNPHSHVYRAWKPL